MLTPDNVNVYFEWLKVCKENKGRLLHKLKYRDRSPLIDVSNYFAEHSYEGVSSDVYGRFLVEYRNRVSSFGFWNRLKSYRPADSVAWDKQPVLCPVCGDGLRFVGRRGRWFFGSDCGFGVVRVVRGGRFLYGVSVPPPQRWLGEF